MLEIKPQGKIVEKIVRAKTGEFVVATFFVVESENGLDVRLISVRPLPKVARITNQESRIKNKIFRLKGECVKSSQIISHRRKYTPTVSPFFNTLEFFVSQPTRAPSFGF